MALSGLQPQHARELGLQLIAERAPRNRRLEISTRRRGIQSSTNYSAALDNLAADHQVGPSATAAYVKREDQLSGSGFRLTIGQPSWRDLALGTDCDRLHPLRLYLEIKRSWLRLTYVLTNPEALVEFS
jgi:hypothetical protein